MDDNLDAELVMALSNVLWSDDRDMMELALQRMEAYRAMLGKRLAWLGKTAS